LATEAIPTACDCRPVSKAALVGEHVGVTWKLLYLNPWSASQSVLGVCISEPKLDKSEKPESSKTMYATFVLVSSFSFSLAIVGSFFLLELLFSPIESFDKRLMFEQPESKAKDIAVAVILFVGNHENSFIPLNKVYPPP